MAFSETQTKALETKLHAKHVRTRIDAGATIPYLEAWHVIAEANRIFGFDAWDRETVETRCVWHGSHHGRHGCSYVARVRIRVRAGDDIVIREGSGSGHGDGTRPGEAHELALKAAETDATKRALVTFGNPFGLALYDPDYAQVRGRKLKENGNLPVRWQLTRLANRLPETFEDPRSFCSAFRAAIRAAQTVDDVDELNRLNADTLDRLRHVAPDLIAGNGQHFADILKRLCIERRQFLLDRSPARSPEKSPEPSAAEEAAFPIGHPKRFRDKEHLAFVARQPCAICARIPSQAHHLTFVQPKALGKKAGDQWTVPLCAAHHREVHDSGDERAWWRRHRIDAEEMARNIWEGRRQAPAGSKRLPAA